MNNNRQICIIAHRGASFYARENTLQAFLLACGQKATAVEIDVRRTADDVLVVSHDRGIKNGRKKIWIDKNSYNNLTSLTNGGLLRLTDVLKRIPKKIVLDIDVKQRGIEKELADLIIKSGRDRLVIIDSYYPGSIVKLRQLLPRALLGFSLAFEDNRDFGRRLPVKILVSLSPFIFRQVAGPLILKVARNCHCDIVNMPVRFASKKTIALLHSIGVKIFVWRVDKEKQMKKLIDLGVDGIKTGRPDLLRKVIESYGYYS